MKVTITEGIPNVSTRVRVIIYYGCALAIVIVVRENGTLREIDFVR